MPKLQKSVERRHFYCSKECFTSSWAVHKQLHVRKERTITLNMDDNITIKIFTWGPTPYKLYGVRFFRPSS